MKRKLWISVIAAVATIFLVGCGSGGTFLGGNYDLSKYLFPRNSGKFIYQYFTAKKPKGASDFSHEEYQNDIQCDVKRDGNSVNAVNRGDDNLSKKYTINSSDILVQEINEGLEYHFGRNVSSTTNFVKESVIKQTREAAGTSTVTYECNATAHINNKVIEPNPRKFSDILTLVCTKRHIISATVGGKKFETVDEIVEEGFYAKDTGLIKSTLTRCQYTKVDSSKQADDGCTRSIYKIWAYVED